MDKGDGTMTRVGFDNDQYISMQSEHIRKRISEFGGKLYLEFGGKLFDDHHASRVLPGFKPDSKLQMLLTLKQQAEIVIVISAPDIENNKMRGDSGITYDAEVLRLIDAFREIDLFVGSVAITQYSGQASAEVFQKRLEALGVKVFRMYSIDGYPYNVKKIVSEDGFGKNEYIQTERVKRARWLILNHDMSMEEISRQVGFSELSYFCKIFKKVVGQTPLQYKKLRGNTLAQK